MLLARTILFPFSALINPLRFMEYYQPKLHLYDPPVRTILQTMADDKCSRDKVNNMVEKYLEYDGRRTPRGLMGVLCALRESKDKVLQAHGRHVVEFFLREEDVSRYNCDQEELQAMLQQLTIKRKQSHEKIKEALVKYRTAELLLINQEAISIIHFYDILSLLTSNQRLSVTINNRLLALANVFNSKLVAFFQLYLAKKLPEHVSRTVNYYFVGTILFYMRDFPLVEKEDVKLLFKLVQEQVFMGDNDRIRKMSLFNVYRYFPYFVCNDQGQYYKDLVLQRVLEKDRKLIDRGEEWHDVIFSYSILTFEFYKTMNSIQFRYEDGLNYLQKEDLQVPQLPPAFWQRYKRNPELVNKDHIARSILKRVYPSQYLSTPAVQSSTIPPPKVTENEVKVRMQLALQRLGLRTQRQVQVSGRYVDFLMDNIVIECDGDHHFQLHIMDYNQSTHFRNLHLLLSGYRLVALNIFEYNANRSTEKLAALLRRKLDLMERRQAVMVL